VTQNGDFLTLKVVPLLTSNGFHSFIHVYSHKQSNSVVVNPSTPAIAICILKHLVPDRVKPSFVIFDIRALWRSMLSVRLSIGCQKLQMTA